jgi:alkylation response protein AidB-like acyl-CoA dehydrogenase
MGISGHALDAFRRFAARRPTGSDRPLSGLSVVQARYGEAVVTVRAARLLFEEALQRSWQRVEGGDDLSAPERASMRLAATHAVRSTVRAIDLLYEVSGTSTLLVESEFGRCWRDAHALAQHTLLSVAGYEQAGAVFLEDGRSDG